MDVNSAKSTTRLEELGYTQQLERRLHVWHVVGLAMADVSPTMAVVFLSAGVFSIAGTFAIGIGFIQSFVVVLIALCLAELATMFPIAGGMYSLVRNVLPAPIAWITMFNYLIQGVVIPASITLGIAAFVKDLIPGLHLGDKPLALILLVAATAIALCTVRVGAWVTVVMVSVELIVLGIVTVAALAHPHQNLAHVTFHPTLLHGAGLAGVAFGAMLASIVAQFNVNNGYDAALGFSEELMGDERSVAKAVVTSAVLAGVLIMIPLIAAIVAAPSLPAFFKAPAPVVYSVQQGLGSSASKIVDFGASIALFNSMLALLMYFGRGVYTTGRDGIWPPPISRAFATLNRFRAPAAGVLVLAVPAAVLIFLSALNFLIVFAGTVIAAVYFCIGLAAVWSRVTQKDIRRPYKMPLWPLPPLIVVIFTGVALVKQEGKYLVAELILIGVSLALWALSGLWRAQALQAVAEVTGAVVPASEASSDAVVLP
jgi:amino acid transporter